MSEHATPFDLSRLEDGDKITVSNRDTPMTVIGVNTTPSGAGVEIVAENQHGEYRLVQFGDENITLRAGGDRKLIGTVEVEYAE